MKETGSNMRPTPRLGEMTIKVPAPFAGLSDLGFTAQYRAQEFNEPQRDVPLLFEGPQPPMRRLAEMLQLLSGTQSSTYAWTDPVMLSDDVVILAFRDRSVAGDTLSDGARIADYVMNLVRPVVFTFLRDCAVVAHLRLSDVIEMRVSADHRPIAEFALPLQKIVQPNGERLLWGPSA
ncbi:MAG: hypothetical protein E6I61_03610 [Chloroflexi bacterium]|nr:MAG: hypothetical protein E6I71_04695 [Chloroflexota bacterium]TME42173.1 MAG: hypothetical protein E6I61_03610 [Chloroflexota bacterium]TME52378.1 MAG: hypothetical protein E6I53_06690 [Chloroflexota bacterium]